MRGRQIANVSKVVALDRVSRKCLRDLIEHCLIDDSSLALRVRVFERNERLPKKLAHLAVDLSGPEVAIVQKDLEPGSKNPGDQPRYSPRRRERFANS